MKIRKFLVLAGEESGLIYAERLKDALQDAQPDAVMEFRGYQSEGFKTADIIEVKAAKPEDESYFNGKVVTMGNHLLREDTLIRLPRH